MERTQTLAPDARPVLLAGLGEDTSEVKQLLASLGFPLEAEFLQNRARPDREYWLGSGKAEEVRQFVQRRFGIVRKGNPPASTATSAPEATGDGLPVDGGRRSQAQGEPLLVLAGDAKPTHKFNLEDKLGVEVWDRTRLILEIFSRRASLREARLQVELAKLRYDVPLLREAVHRMKSGERPGYMGGGEYAVADYEETVRKRMRHVRQELERVRGERAERRKARHEAFHLASLAGYTNAGKTRLLDALTGAEKPHEDRLFTTLSTATRRLDYARFRGELPGLLERPILLTDTVGFIRDLPSWLLDAFHSTLEEIALADVVLLVLDVSEEPERIASKLLVCQQELAHLDVTAPVVTAVNKADLVPEDALRARLRFLEAQRLVDPERTLAVSAATGRGLPELVHLLGDQLPVPRRLAIELPNDAGSTAVINQLHGLMRVEDMAWGERAAVKGVCDPLEFKSIVSLVRERGGVVRVVS